MVDILSTLITSKTRIRVLMKFFINSDVDGYLRNLESEFGESCNAIRIELNRFEKAGLLSTSFEGNKKIYQPNTNHPNYRDIKTFLHKIIGIDNLSKLLIEKIPILDSAYLTGKLAHGLDSRIFDLLLIGNNLDKIKIAKLVKKFESNDSRKIRYLIFSPDELTNYLKESTAFLIWHKTD